MGCLHDGGGSEWEVCMMGDGVPFLSACILQ